jgi:hypothetical protein
MKRGGLSFFNWKPKPGATDTFSQVIARDIMSGDMMSSGKRGKSRSKAYASNRTKPPRRKK